MLLNVRHPSEIYDRTYVRLEYVSFLCSNLLTCCCGLRFAYSNSVVRVLMLPTGLAGGVAVFVYRTNTDSKLEILHN